MPSRIVVAKELASIFSILSHPDRVRIVAELRQGEKDVNGLQATLGVSHSRVSQHLSGLKAHRIVQERREGRHVFYHLTQPELANWLIQGLRFVEGEAAHTDSVRAAIREARGLWNNGGTPVAG
ncbi:MAG: helix-turn-helix transcriptional regulator [Bryobacterales bacterium]|jgi:DNA-binding transcriptional ArsR family regulator|nr:helix-turn-helix transcriptional regulator [Bryobacterales bacterium]